MNFIVLSFTVYRRLDRASLAGIMLALIALAGGLLTTACATGKDYSAVYVNEIAELHESYIAQPFSRGAGSYPEYIEQARQFTEYLQTIEKAKAAARASPHVIAVDERRSLLAYAEGITNEFHELYGTMGGGPFLEKSEPYTRSVLIGECTGIIREPQWTNGYYTITIRIDHAGSPALPDYFNRYREFTMGSIIWANGSGGPIIPFEVGETYMFYASSVTAIPPFVSDDYEFSQEDSARVDPVGAFLNGFDFIDTEGEFYPPVTPIDSLLSVSPYRHAGGLDFNMHIIPGPEGGEVWGAEALRYAPFIKLDASGAAGALDSEAGFLWKKWIELARVSQSTLRVIATNRRESIPYFYEEPRIYGRSFTDAEYRSGARVCLISRELAYKNGLRLGDTISLAFFNNGYIHDGLIEGIPAFIRPIPYTMKGAKIDNPVRYKIIGFYVTPELKMDIQSDAYNFLDANVVFVPGASLKKTYPAPQAAPITDPETGGTLIPYTPRYAPELNGMFSVVLRKGAEGAFKAEMEAQGIGELFKYYDGYSVYGIQDFINAYRR